MMVSTPESCAVALPMQRNCATSENGATGPATRYTKKLSKPASIRELRTQLVAQQQRNKAATVRPAEMLEVARVASCASCVPSDRNCATDLVREFMEVDGLTLEEAQALAAISVIPRPQSEWMALIDELHALIDRYCDTRGFSMDDRSHIHDVGGRQSLASIPLDVDWFRRELEARHG